MMSYLDPGPPQSLSEPQTVAGPGQGEGIKPPGQLGSWPAPPWGLVVSAHRTLGDWPSSGISHVPRASVSSL